MKSKIFNFLIKLKHLVPLIINIYLFVFGLGWVLVHLFFRVIAERKPYIFEDIKHDVSLKHFIIFALFLMLHLVLISASILILYRKNKEDLKIKLPKLFILLFDKLNFCIDLLYWKPLEFLHDVIAPHIPYSAAFFVYLEKKWSNNHYEKNYFLGMIFLFDSLPKIIVAVSFFVDIVIYAQMKYFFYFIPFILIPIMFSIFLKLLISCGVRNVPILRDYFSEIKGIDPIYNKGGEIVNYKKYECKVKPEYTGVIDPEEEMLLLLQFDSMQRYGLKIKEDIKSLSPYITLITSIIYLISGIIRYYIIFT